MGLLLRRWVTVGFMLSVCGAGAQTLARPGWAGARVSREPWWAHAVLYRLDPARFQDSDGDGRGDLHGVTERLEYLQALGVDALVLAMPDVQKDPAAAKGFDELTREAASRHLRVMVELQPGNASDAVVLAEARFWLNQGAAGLALRSEALTAMHDAVRAASLLHQLRALVGTFPGGRVLAAGSSVSDAAVLTGALQREAQLVFATPMKVETPLEARLGLRSASAAAPIVQVSAQPRDARVGAVVLLASPNPVLIEAGQELGLGATADGGPALMQWTPSDVTIVPVAVAVETAAPAPEFRAFKPYIPPPPRSLVGEPVRPVVVETDASPAVDPSLLPGFTTAAGAALLPVEPRLATNAAAANVREEERDPASVLSLYRRLVQLRHDDPALRAGSQVFLDEDALGALVWLRRTGAEMRIVVCNLSAVPLHLSLDAELARLKVRGGVLRDLVAGGASAANVQRSDDVSLPAGGVMVGRVYR